MYRSIDVKEHPTKLEKRINNIWQSKKIAKKSEDYRESAPKFVFYEGPPTANGLPGIHHVISRTLKDSVCRYKTMRGFQVRRKAGWDTHGLPVEIEVQKQLGIKTKKDIEAYGIEKFNKKCQESVFTYEKEWREMTTLLGYWLDMDHPYITLQNEYIESVWWLLNQFWKAGLIYQEHKIVPYCPSCGTPLSSHEVALGYEEAEDPSIYVKFKVKDQKNTYLLAWTTTPWTLISNVALVVHPDEVYVKIKTNNEYLILAKARLDVLEDNYTVVAEYKGVDLEYLKYEPLFTYYKEEGSSEKAWYVALGNYVTMDDGTGVVHTAPAFGEEDYQTGRRYGLPFIQPVNEEGKFNEHITDWADMFVKDADKEIIRNLKARGLLYRQERIKHTYPFCWRCGSPLIYFARKSWYIKTTAYAAKMLENNRRINWIPRYVGEKRFGDWLAHNIDWAISRDRYWGTPLNIWICEKCHTEDSPESISEMRANGRMEDGNAVPEDIKLHRPYVDKVVFTCPKCGGTMHRTTEVIDCWFDSGSMPFAQWHYPFENKERFDQELFPADFIAEGIDQTRGWFYTLLAISTFIKGISAYKTCLVNELVLDKNGIKMSKSRGNTVNVFDIFEKYGADATRWYMLAVSPPWVPTRFDENGIKEVQSKFISTFKNVASFFITYANIDKYNYDEYLYIIPSERQEVDRWILSRLNTLIKAVVKNNDRYEFTRSARLIQNFVINDLSNWYVRRVRKRCWAPGVEKDKISAYSTLYEAIITVTKLCAPFAPFVTEEIFVSLTGKESVHLEDYPSPDENLIDTQLEQGMQTIINIVTLARAARNNVQIKIRQPLLTLYLPAKYKDVVERFKDLVYEEINIKNIQYITDKDQFVVYEVKPNFKTLGPRYGNLLPHIAEALQRISPKHLIDEIQNNGAYHLDIEGTPVKLTQEDISVDSHNKKQFTFKEEGEVFVALDTALNKSLILEGNARELVNKIQFMRKEKNFDIMDRIQIFYFSPNDEIKETLTAFCDYIKQETLAQKVVEKDERSDMKEWDINGKPVFLKLKVVSS
jgi:isoleucyl-tRNA synthetase